MHRFFQILIYSVLLSNSLIAYEFQAHSFPGGLKDARSVRIGLQERIYVANGNSLHSWNPATESSVEVNCITNSQENNSTNGCIGNSGYIWSFLYTRSLIMIKAFNSTLYRY